MTLKKFDPAVRDMVASMFPYALFADGFDGAIIGTHPFEQKVVYDSNKMIKILMQDGMSEIDAMDYLSFNVLNTYVGEHTPIYVACFSVSERRSFERIYEELNKPKGDK